MCTRGVLLSFQGIHLTLCFSRFLEAIFLSETNQRDTRRRDLIPDPATLEVDGTFYVVAYTWRGDTRHLITAWKGQL
jgi:hypothetical protein